MIVDSISFLANIFTIIASGIAIYLFVFKRDAVKSVFKVLTNYSYQISLSELKIKLERLNELSVNDQSQSDEIINIFNEIVGQIRGNVMLKNKCEIILKKLTRYAETPRILTEPKKRSIISELREKLRHIDIQNIDELMED